jgi:hypothetical protein
MSVKITVQDIFQAVIFSLLLAGCTSFSLLKPVNPSAGNPQSEPDLVTSLQPTLSWEPVADTGTAYDLVIYEKLKAPEEDAEGIHRVGNQVYYVQGIKESHANVQTPLLPDTDYYWSVRTRKGSEVSDWSRYDYSLFLLVNIINVHNTYFIFRTPHRQP